MFEILSKRWRTSGLAKASRTFSPLLTQLAGSTLGYRAQSVPSPEARPEMVLCVIHTLPDLPQPLAQPKQPCSKNTILSRQTYLDMNCEVSAIEHWVAKPDRRRTFG